jgi:two-component system nitrogen regulation response regulator GlnG
MAEDPPPTAHEPDPHGERTLAATAVIAQGPDAGLEFPLRRAETVLGSGDRADIAIADPAVSKRHLGLSLVGSAVRLRDLGSTNGTWVGEHRVVESLVPVGTIVRIGRTHVHLRGEDASLVVEPSASDRFGALRGTSVAMRQVYAVLERVAPRDVTVLVDGETGTGKELVARAIHDHSPRKARPFVVLDCSAVAPDLLEAQLFGHAKGAFTGASGERAGVFEAARGGTVFLDELDALRLDLQPKLLRALESRRVVRLGEHEERPVDMRVVAACGQSPEALVGTGAMRRDLYFRLAVVRLTLPTLRDRLDDLPLLAEHLLAIGGASLRVEPGPAIERLKRHTWPGNVRELRNVLERALALAPPGATTLDELPLRIGAAPPRDGSPEDQDLPFKEAKQRAIDRWERGFLKAASERHGGNLSRMAEALGVTRHHLRALLTRHGIDR